MQRRLTKEQVEFIAKHPDKVMAWSLDTIVDTLHQLANDGLRLREITMAGGISDEEEQIREAAPDLLQALKELLAVKGNMQRCLLTYENRLRYDRALCAAHGALLKAGGDNSYDPGGKTRSDLIEENQYLLRELKRIRDREKTDYNLDPEWAADVARKAIKWREGR